IITYLAAFLGGIFKLSRKIFTPQSWYFCLKNQSALKRFLNSSGPLPQSQKMNELNDLIGGWSCWQCWPFRSCSAPFLEKSFHCLNCHTTLGSVRLIASGVLHSAYG
ncbi:hypothetical protein AABM27_16565, partial [Heyndrickxia faecalis]|uniref:hypothetical protein n=1 Tax=Heyndrickxia faecalis TaxID=2824910 RepID=UPI0031012136